MEQTERDRKRSMRLFALSMIIATTVICALTFGSAIQKMIKLALT